MSENKQPPLIRSDALAKLNEVIAQLTQQTFSHPLNPNSEIHSVSLSEQVGM